MMAERKKETRDAFSAAAAVFVACTAVDHDARPRRTFWQILQERVPPSLSTLSPLAFLASFAAFFRAERSCDAGYGRAWSARVRAGVEAGAEKSRSAVRGPRALRLSTRRTSAVSFGSASGLPSSSFFLPVLRLRRSGLGVLPFPGGFLAAEGAITTAAIPPSAFFGKPRGRGCLTCDFQLPASKLHSWRIRNILRHRQL